MTALTAAEMNLTNGLSRLNLDFDVLSRLMAAAALSHLEQTRGRVAEPAEARGATWAASDGIEQAIQEVMREPVTPRDRWLEEAAEEVGEVLTGAWLQYLDFALERQGEVTLGMDLLPTNDHPGSFADAFRECLCALPVLGGVDGAAAVLTSLARTLLGGGPGLDLPMFLAIDVEEGARRAYVARRHREVTDARGA